MRRLALAAVSCSVAFSGACVPQRSRTRVGAGGPVPIVDGGGAASCDNRVSDDLHSLLSCTGAAIKQCPDDQGMAPDGTCVAPCTAAQLNSSTVGCEYFAVEPNILPVRRCYAAFIANTWKKPVALEVEHAGQSLNLSSFARIPSGSGLQLTYASLPGGQIPPGEVAILFLAEDEGASVCPGGVTPAFVGSIARPITGFRELSFRIRSSAPVVAYDIAPYGGGSSAVASASLLLPVSAWDKSYIAATAYVEAAQNQNSHPWIQIVAAQDQTNVTIKPSVDIVEGEDGVMATSKGTPVTYPLGQGQYLLLAQHDEPAGSIIQADKPIGVFGGHFCMAVRENDYACDGAHQQIPPLKAFGHEYVAVRYRNRFDDIDESPPWRLVGAADGTQLTYDPAPPPGAPDTIGLGEMVEFGGPGPFVVRSQDADHPFYMAAYMTGANSVSQTDLRGDPEFVNVVPAAQYLSSYVFFTDPTYSETDLVMVRSQGSDGLFKDVTLDCLQGPISGWMPVGTSGQYEYTRVDLVRHNFEKQAGCDNGRHELSSDGPVGLTVWGWGLAETGGDENGTSPGFYTQYTSYAYPAGMRIRAINKVVLPIQ